MQDLHKTVKQVFYIDENFLTDCAEKEVKGDYFKSSLAFYQRVKDKAVKDISKSQQSWLYNLSGVLQQKMKRQLQKPVYKQKVKKYAWLPKKTNKGWVWMTHYWE